MLCETRQSQDLQRSNQKKKKERKYLQYPPRIILIVRNAPRTHPSLQHDGIQPRVVGVHPSLAVVDEAAHRSVALVGLLCLSLSFPSDVEKKSTHPGDQDEDAGDDACRDPRRAGTAT